MEPELETPLTPIKMVAQEHKTRTNFICSVINWIKPTSNRTSKPQQLTPKMSIVEQQNPSSQVFTEENHDAEGELQNVETLRESSLNRKKHRKHGHSRNSKDNLLNTLPLKLSSISQLLIDDDSESDVQGVVLQHGKFKIYASDIKTSVGESDGSMPKNDGQSRREKNRVQTSVYNNDGIVHRKKKNRIGSGGKNDHDFDSNDDFDGHDHDHVVKPHKAAKYLAKL